MNINQTRIPIGGVFRCCLVTIAADKTEVEIGDMDACPHCKTVFTLTQVPGEKFAQWLDLALIERTNPKKTKESRDE